LTDPSDFEHKNPWHRMNVGKTWGIVALTFQTRGPNGKIGVSDFCTWRVYCSSDSDVFFS
jgi:hypothetical protein